MGEGGGGGLGQVLRYPGSLLMVTLTQLLVAGSGPHTAVPRMSSAVRRDMYGEPVAHSPGTWDWRLALLRTLSRVRLVSACALEGASSRPGVS